MKESNYNYKTHWDNAYKKNSSKNLGWFESDPKLSIEMIEKCNLNKNSVLFNAGAGTSKLIKVLIKKGFENIIINDISSIAILKYSINSLIQIPELFIKVKGFIA